MSHRAAGTQRLRDAATLLPIVVAILLLPPFILVFAAPILIAGIPLIVIYVFGLWATVIFAAWLVAHRHARAAVTPYTSADTGSAEAPPGSDLD